MLDGGHYASDEQAFATSCKQREQAKRVVSRFDPEWGRLFDRAAAAIERSRFLQRKFAEVLSRAERFLRPKRRRNAGGGRLLWRDPQRVVRSGGIEAHGSRITGPSLFVLSLCRPISDRPRIPLLEPRVRQVCALEPRDLVESDESMDVSDGMPGQGRLVVA